MTFDIPSNLINSARAATSRTNTSIYELLGIGQHKTKLKACYNTVELYECPGVAQDHVLTVESYTGLSRSAIIDTLKMIYGKIGKCTFWKEEWEWISSFGDDFDDQQRLFLSCSWGLCQIRARLVVLDLFGRGVPLSPEEWIPACAEFYRNPTSEFELLSKHLENTEQKTIIQRYNYYLYRYSHPMAPKHKLITVLPEATDAAQIALQIRDYLNGQQVEEAEK